jgi:hypothetical protein
MSNESPSGKWGINLETVHCPKCGTKMPTLRVPESVHELMWGGWTCPDCGCRMDKWGKALDPA